MMNLNFKKIIFLFVLVFSTSLKANAMSCRTQSSYTAGLYKYEKGICQSGVRFEIEGLALGFAWTKPITQIRCQSKSPVGNYYGSSLEAGIGFGFEGGVFYNNDQGFCVVGSHAGYSQETFKANVGIVLEMKILSPTQESIELAKKTFFY